MSYQVHFFVCTNSPQKEGKCGTKGAEELRSSLKEKTDQLGLKGKVRINSSGCLGKCEQGIACVAYPQNRWFFNQTPNQEQELLAAIQSLVQES